MAAGADPTALDKVDRADNPRAEVVAILLAAATLVLQAEAEQRRLYEKEEAALATVAEAQSAALVPTLEAMKLAAPKTGPLAAEGAVRLFNVFQDLGQVTGPIAGGFAMKFVGFERAAEWLGVVSVFYAVTMLVYLSSVRPLPRHQSAAHFTFTG